MNDNCKRILVKLLTDSALEKPLPVEKYTVNSLGVQTSGQYAWVGRQKGDPSLNNNDLSRLFRCDFVKSVNGSLRLTQAGEIIARRTIEAIGVTS